MRHSKEPCDDNAEQLYINWINVEAPTRASVNGITKMLIDAGYRPDGRAVIERLRERYESGLKDDDGRYIRVPQEDWYRNGVKPSQSDEA